MASTLSRSAEGTNLSAEDLIRRLALGAFGVRDRCNVQELQVVGGGSSHLKRAPTADYRGYSTSNGTRADGDGADQSTSSDGGTGADQTYVVGDG